MSHLREFSGRERRVLASCALPGRRPIRLDKTQAVGGREQHASHDYATEVDSLTEQGLITPGRERYELTAAGAALMRMPKWPSTP